MKMIKVLIAVLLLCLPLWSATDTLPVDPVKAGYIYLNRFDPNDLSLLDEMVAHGYNTAMLAVREWHGPDPCSVESTEVQDGLNQTESYGLTAFVSIAYFASFEDGWYAHEPNNYDLTDGDMPRPCPRTAFEDLITDRLVDLAGLTNIDGGIIDFEIYPTTPNTIYKDVCICDDCWAAFDVFDPNVDETVTAADRAAYLSTNDLESQYDDWWGAEIHDLAAACVDAVDAVDSDFALGSMLIDIDAYVDGGTYPFYINFARGLNTNDRRPYNFSEGTYNNPPGVYSTNRINLIKDFFANAGVEIFFVPGIRILTFTDPSSEFHQKMAQLQDETDGFWVFQLHSLLPGQTDYEALGDEYWRLVSLLRIAPSRALSQEGYGGKQALSGGKQ